MSSRRGGGGSLQIPYGLVAYATPSDSLPHDPLSFWTTMLRNVMFHAALAVLVIGAFVELGESRESLKWDVGHGGISPYLNRLQKDHNKESNRYLTPSELLKEENVVTSTKPWFKTSKQAMEKCSKDPGCKNMHCRSIRKISNLVKCNNVGGALSTMFCSKLYPQPYSYQCVDESPLYNGDRGWAARK